MTLPVPPLFLTAQQLGIIARNSRYGEACDLIPWDSVSVLQPITSLEHCHVTKAVTSPLPQVVDSILAVEEQRALSMEISIYYQSQRHDRK